MIEGNIQPIDKVCCSCYLIVNAIALCMFVRTSTLLFKFNHIQSRIVHFM